MATARIWNGTSWVDKTSKASFSYWNGTAWTVPTDVRHWNGTSWETLFAAPPATNVLYRAESVATSNGANSIGVTIPGSVQIGDLLVLMVAQSNNGGTYFGAISGWTARGDVRAGSAAFTMAVYTRLAQAGDAGSTVTVTAVTSAPITVHVRAFSNVNQTTPLDATVSFLATDTNVTSGSAPAVTIATTGAMILTAYGMPTTAGTSLTSADWTAPSGFGGGVFTCTTAAGLNNAAFATFYRLAPGTGSQGPFTAATTQARRWAAATIAIRPA